MEEHDIENQGSTENEKAEEISLENVENSEKTVTDEKSLLEDLNDKYLRLYAEFDNYKKRVNKDKEELVQYGNESLLYELLPAIDSLELALKHASGDSNTSLVHGVEMTLKELHRTLEKFGLVKIESLGKKFDPVVHHAMMNVERDDMEEKVVAEELRAGYIYRDKVLRPSLVAVSVKPQGKTKQENENSEAESETKNVDIKINKDIEEE